MIANIISRYSYALTDVLMASDYAVAVDGDYSGKSQFTFHRKPIATEDDFIILKDGNFTFQGIISEIENEKGKSSYTVTVLEMPALFDQKILPTNEGLLQTGIEDFIADQIRSNFIENDDAIVNIPYLEVVAKTHTPVAAKVSAEKGVYNLCTYIGNALTNYGVFISFDFTMERLTVILEKREAPAVNIDTGISDIVNLSETLEVKALAKLTVVWQYKKPVEGGAEEGVPEGGIPEEGETVQEIRHFFLKTDRTITEDMHDPDRASGSTDVIVSEAETEAGMIQDARNVFTGNSYNHKIAFDLISTSKLLKLQDVYVGRKCFVKTKIGIKSSIISKLERKYNRKSISVTLGNMKVTLIEKLKGVEKK